jgi:hypothetical protein
MPANDVDDRALLAHVGYHKTGTTWLQREVFANPGLGFRVALDKEEVLRLLIEPRAVSFDAAGCRAAIAAALDSKEARQEVPVISSEELCGSPHSGAVLEKELADRLAATVPGARILIVIREQRAMLASAYKQFVRAGGTLSLDTFLSPASLGDPRTGLPDWRHYRYDGLIRCYR